MKFFKGLQRRREADRAAISNSLAVLEEMIRTDPEVDRNHEDALLRLVESSAQAQQLRSANRRNHYSESLTKAFRGRPA